LLAVTVYLFDADELTNKARFAAIFRVSQWGENLTPASRELNPSHANQGRDARA
jgi:hypothetical protein